MKKLKVGDFVMHNRISWFELAGVEHVRALRNGTKVILSNISPGSVIHANPQFAAIFAEVEKRAPLGFEHIQLDGICRYEAQVWNSGAKSLLAHRAKQAAAQERSEQTLIDNDDKKQRELARKEEIQNDAWLAKRYGWPA